MEETKRIILIQGEGSKWYEQAIFIIKSGNPNSSPIPKDFVLEAENIVSKYLSSGIKHNLQTIYSNNESTKTTIINNPAKVKKNKKLDFLLNLTIVFCCITIAVLVSKLF